MNLITPGPRRLRSVLAWLSGRGDASRGLALADDILELYRERRARRGRPYAMVRGAFDTVTLVVRPRPGTADHSGGQGSGLQLLTDLRCASRGLWRRPLAPVAAFAAMLLGIALTALTFVVVRGVLLNPLPFTDGHRLVSVYGEFRPESGYSYPRIALSSPEFLDFESSSRTVIAGIAGDVRSIGPTQAPEPAIYVSHAQRPRSAYSGAALTVVVRSAGRGSPVNLREVARAVNPRAASTTPRDLTDALGAVLARPRFLSVLMSGFAAIAFTIALVGIYALVAYSVSSRVHDIGVRVALGASRVQVMALASRQLGRTLVIGVPTGLAAGWLLSTWMAVLLYDVRPWEPMLYAVVAISLAVAAVLATIVPLRRAMCVDPLVALRAE